MDAPAVQILLKNASNGLQIFAGCIYEEDYKKLSDKRTQTNYAHKIWMT